LVDVKQLKEIRRLTNKLNVQLTKLDVRCEQLKYSQCIRSWAFSKIS